jgi:hypothetical protein
MSTNPQNWDYSRVGDSTKINGVDGADFEPRSGRVHREVKEALGIVGSSGASLSTATHRLMCIGPYRLRINFHSLFLSHLTLDDEPAGYSIKCD